MACTSVTIPASPTGSVAKEISHKSLHRSHSGKDLCARAGLRRSYSDTHLCYSINRIRASSAHPKLKSSSSSVKIFPMFQLPGSILPSGLRSFLFDPETSKDMNIVENGVDIDNKDVEKRANWVVRLLELRSRWRNKPQRENLNGDEDGAADSDGDEGGCEVDYDEVEARENYNRETFSRLLSPVAWSDTKFFSQLAFLCNMAYVIPEIKAQDLRRHYGLKFVTSSLEKKAEAAAIKAKLDHDSTRVPISDPADTGSSSEKAMDSEQKPLFRPSVAYEIAASAASYVHSCTKDLLSPESPSRVYKSEVAAFVAASTMTAVVAAGEKEKQEAAKDLQSLHSAPCEWFVCDDSSTYTRCFVIQGSDSLASWQANLFFDPTQFEGTDVIVHRGIYEAAKGIFEQFMPEIIYHLNRYGDRAKLQFTGHSLGGSLSLLVNLMLLSRKVVKPSNLLPVVTFGSPFVFCGGERILGELGLDDNHVHCVMMHRDIVPRAFSCNYPNHVAQVLKSLSGAFRSHPCLNKNKLLYSPMGKIFILQPDEKSSPSHPLLPSGNALYAFDKTQCACPASAIRAFINCPHPLETLSDPTAYGSEGTILRDHDSSNYLKAVNGVLRQHTKTVLRRVRRQGNLMWPLLTSPSPHAWNHEEKDKSRGSL
ncbi:unnamed protein product, partial [Vitis vinifera]